jgi:hypothetical protein
MPRVATLDLQLTADARARAKSLLRKGDLDPSTLCLLKGRRDDEPQEHWYFGLYGPQNVDFLSQELEGLDRALLYDVGGLIVAIPQVDLLVELYGKTLAIRQERIVVLERERGI